MKNLESEFVPYPLALRMKVLGYKEPCLAWYVSEKYGLELGEVKFGDLIKDGLLAPTWQSAFRWFREKYGIEGFIHKAIEGTYYFVIKRVGNNESNMYEFTKTIPKQFDTYEEAEVKCLEELIKIANLKLCNSTIP
jgi:hypothetical protein